MSFYTDGSIKTEIIDSNIHVSKGRTEFKLNRGTILSNLYISNLGNTVTHAGNDYSQKLGVLQNIKNIHLMDGGVSLQSIYDVNRTMSFKNALKSNQHNSDVDRYLKKHSLGYAHGFPDAVTAQGLTPHNYNIVVANVGDNNQREGGIPAKNGAQTDGDTEYGLIDVRELLPFLKKIICLPSSIFKQLRLVIEYETNRRNLFQDIRGDFENINPQLIIDRVVNEETEKKLIGSLSSFSYANYEYTNFIIPQQPTAGGPPVTTYVANAQNTSRKIKAFNKKYLNRMRVQIGFSDPTATEVVGNNQVGTVVGDALTLGADASYAVRVNGKDILPDSKVVGIMRPLAYTVDSYGGENYVYNEVGLFTNKVNLFSDDNVFRNGKSYNFAIKVGEFIDELIVDVGRVIDTKRLGTEESGRFGVQIHPNLVSEVNRFGDEMRVTIEGETIKQLVFGAGGYVVGYINNENQI